MPRMTILADLQSVLETLSQIENKIFIIKKEAQQKRIAQISDISSEENLIIEAMLNGNISDKNIHQFLLTRGCKYFSIRHRLTKLFERYDCINREQLLQKLIKEFA